MTGEKGKQIAKIFAGVHKYLLKFVVPPASMDLFTQMSAYASRAAQGRPKLFVQSRAELISEPRLEQRHSDSQAHSHIVVTILLPKLYSQSRSEMIISQSAKFGDFPLYNYMAVM